MQNRGVSVFQFAQGQFLSDLGFRLCSYNFSLKIRLYVLVFAPQVPGGNQKGQTGLLSKYEETRSQVMSDIVSHGFQSTPDFTQVNLSSLVFSQVLFLQNVSRHQKQHLNQLLSRTGPQEENLPPSQQLSPGAAQGRWQGKTLRTRPHPQAGHPGIRAPS